MMLKPERRITMFMMLCFVTLAQMLLQAGAVGFMIPSSETKCVFEQIQTDEAVLAHYSVISDKHDQLHTISAKVVSPDGNYLHQSDNVTQGQFAFITTEIGTYVACFRMNGKEGAILNLEWKTGFYAKDWESLANKLKINEFLKGVELEFMKLEEAVEAIHNHLIYLKDIEAKMREVIATVVSKTLLSKEEAHIDH